MNSNLQLQVLLKTCLNAPYYKKVAIGRQNIKLLADYIRSFKESPFYNANDTIANFVVLSALKPIIGADGVFDQDEYEYIRDVCDFDFDYEYVLDALNAFDSNVSRQLKNTFCYAPSDIKAAFCSLAIFICSVDGSISPEEQRAIADVLCRR